MNSYVSAAACSHCFCRCLRPPKFSEGHLTKNLPFYPYDILTGLKILNAVWPEGCIGFLKYPLDLWRHFKTNQRSQVLALTAFPDLIAFLISSWAPEGSPGILEGPRAPLKLLKSLNFGFPRWPRKTVKNPGLPKVHTGNH